MSQFPLETDLTPAEASLYSEKLGQDSKGDLWIRTFLISHAKNARGWSINPKTSMQKVLSAIKKPITIFRDSISKRVDHPNWDNRKSADANFKEQSKYAIGNVERVFYSKDKDCYYADCKITDADAKQYINSFQDKKIPLPVSPQIIYDARTEKPDYYSDWFFSHLAIVEKGAYGPDAKVLHVCEGDGDSCHKQFENTAIASAPSTTFTLTQPANAFSYTLPPLLSENELGFCKTQALKDASASIFDTSHVSQTDISKTSKMPDSMVEVKPDTQTLQQTTKTDATPNKQAVSVPANVESITFNYPKPEAPYFKDAPSVTEQARQQVEEARKAENKKSSENEPNKDKKSDNQNQDEQQQNEQGDVAAYQQQIAELTKQVKQLQKESQEAQVQRRLAEVANAIPQYLPEFLSEGGKFSEAKYRKTVEDLAAKPYSVEDIHFLYQPRIEAFEQHFQKSVGIGPNPEQMAQQAVTNAPSTPAKASAPETQGQVYKVPDTKSAEASSAPQRTVPEFIQVPPNGKRAGRLA